MNIVEPVFGTVSIDLIRPSASNPRKRFDQAALEELANSIKQSGLGQPILVRPLANIDSDVPDRVEIVAGERRYRASKLAGLTTIPAMVRDMTDAEVLEFQLVENLQREDVHPIEEAEGYERLMKEHKFTADECAEKVGKSRSYIYGRLKFCALADNVRTAFYEGKLNASTALLIARIPVHALQIKATSEIISWNGSDTMSYRRALEHIQDRYMLELQSAPFSIRDAKLVPGAGACDACPKRTGNQPELFKDVDSADMCTDPDCFAAKHQAGNEKTLSVATKKGTPIIEADSIWSATNKASSLTSDANKVWNFDRVSGQGNKSILEALSVDQRPEPKAFLKLPDGGVHALYDKTAIQEALEKAGLALTLEQHNAALQEKLSGDDRADDDDAGPSEKEKERQALLQENQRRVDFENMVRMTAYGKIRTAAKDPASATTVLQVIARLMLNEWSLPDDVLEYDFDTSSDEEIGEHIQQCKLGELLQLMLDTTVGSALTTSTWELDRDEMDEDPYYCAIRELAKAVDIDIDALRDDMGKAATAESDAKVEVPTAAPAGKKTKSKSKAKDAAAPAPNPAAAWPFPTGTRP